MAEMSVAEMSGGRNVRGRNVRGRNVLDETSVAEMSVAEMSEHPWNNSIKIHFPNIFFLPTDYDDETWHISYNSKFTLTSKVAMNNHSHYKEG